MKDLKEPIIIGLIAAIVVLATITVVGAADYRSPYVESIGSYKGPTTLYDRHGIYQGRKNSNGYIYNKNGMYSGRIDNNGSIYDKHGTYKGRIERNDQ